jgi:hypothetical protein
MPYGRKILPVVLATVAASCVQEHYVLVALSGLLIEDLAFAPQRGLDIGISTDDDIFVCFRLFVCGRLACESIVQELEDAAPDVCPMGERSLAVLCQPWKLLCADGHSQLT